MKATTTYAAILTYQFKTRNVPVARVLRLEALQYSQKAVTEKPLTRPVQLCDEVSYLNHRN